jgi:hypothetical protein
MAMARAEKLEAKTAKNPTIARSRSSKEKSQYAHRCDMAAISPRPARSRQRFWDGEEGLTNKRNWFSVSKVRKFFRTRPALVAGERVLFIGTQFSNLYTAVDTPARGRVGQILTGGVGAIALEHIGSAK